MDTDASPCSVAVKSGITYPMAVALKGARYLISKLAILQCRV